MSWMFVNKRQLYADRSASLAKAREAHLALHDEEKKIFFKGPWPSGDVANEVLGWMFARHKADMDGLFKMQVGVSFFNDGMPFAIKSGDKMRRENEMFDRMVAAHIEAVHAADHVAFANDTGPGSTERKKALLSRQAKEKAYMSCLVSSTYSATNGL
jgi:hypothetical protein